MWVDLVEVDGLLFVLCSLGVLVGCCVVLWLRVFFFRIVYIVMNSVRMIVVRL